MNSQFTIRPATIDDVPLVYAFIREIAEYERLLEEVVATPELVRESLFGPRPAAEAILAFQGDEPAGFAVYFQNYSTFQARPGIYLEDLFVRPAARGTGIGKALLARVAAIAVERGCTRLVWSALDWNELAIRFYLSLGSQPKSEWTSYHLSGEPLQRLAQFDAGR